MSFSRRRRRHAESGRDREHLYAPRFVRAVNDRGQLMRAAPPFIPRGEDSHLARLGRLERGGLREGRTAKSAQSHKANGQAVSEYTRCGWVERHGERIEMPCSPARRSLVTFHRWKVTKNYSINSFCEAKRSLFAPAGHKLRLAVRRAAYHLRSAICWRR